MRTPQKTLGVFIMMTLGVSIMKAFNQMILPNILIQLLVHPAVGWRYDHFALF